LNKLLEPIYDSFENEDIKEFCELVVSDLPQYWWNIPASSTGKYHPSYSLGESGLLRHSISVVRFLNWYLELEQNQNKFTGRERDLLKIAALVHDGKKSGESDEAKETYTVFEHPLLMADEIRAYKGNRHRVSNEEIEYIASAIETHMGEFNTNRKSKTALPKPQTPAQELIHLCDYLSSRKDLEMSFDGWEKPELPPLDTYVLDFGRHKGRKLVEVAMKEPSYITWLKSDYGKEPVRSLVKLL